MRIFQFLSFIFILSYTGVTFSAMMPNQTSIKHTSNSVEFKKAAQPLIIAHRGGTADGPENTIPTIKSSVQNGADIIWITVQLSKDGVPVLYRPSDLAALTELTEPTTVSSMTAEELTELDAGHAYFKNVIKNNGDSYKIPTLSEVLIQFPNSEFFIDLKSPDANAKEYIESVAHVVMDNNASHRVRIYSTSENYIDAASKYSSLNVFKSRDETRSILFGSKLSNQCNAKEMLPGWHAFELNRQVDVVGHFMLGEGRTEASFRWSKEDLSCFDTINNKIVLIGVNSKEDYLYAQSLGVYAVMVDSPKAVQCYKENPKRLYLCK